MNLDYQPVGVGKKVSSVSEFKNCVRLFLIKQVLHEMISCIFNELMFHIHLFFYLRFVDIKE